LALHSALQLVAVAVRRKGADMAVASGIIAAIHDSRGL